MIEKNGQYYLRISKEKCRAWYEQIKKKVSKSFIKGLLLGIILISVFNITQAITAGIMEIFKQIALVIGIWIAVQLGIDQEYKWMRDPPEELADRYDNASEEDKDKARQMMFLGGVDIIGAFIFGILAWVCFMGAYIWDFFAVGFPIMTEIRIETDFGSVNLFYWLKTLTTVAQFILMLIITRKIKRKIKRKINDKYRLKERFSEDGFDRAFFAPTI